MSFPQYPKHKDSGVEWLGEIPQHWEVVRVGTLFREVAEDGEDGLPILSVSIHDGVSDKELSDDEVDRKVTRSDDLSKYKKVCPGDLVYNMMRAWQGGFGTVSVAGQVSPAYVVARPKADFHTRFIEHLLRTPPAVEEMRRHSRGVTDFRLRLYWEEFKVIKLAMPETAEQAAICDFLDREAGQIDALVTEQEKLIELLKEKRQAVITHTVTKGLDSTVQTKGSGIKWLGEVPGHWKINRLKHVCSHVVDCLHTTPTYDGDVEFPAVRTADVERGVLLLDQTRLVSREVYEERIQRLKPVAGDILYSREGERFGMAALVPANVELCLGQRMMMFRVLDNVHSEYIMWLLNSDSVYKQVLEKIGGSTSPHVNISDIINFYIPCPPRKEQRQIAKHISNVTASLDALIAEAQRAIDLLKERRSALISAAVTGKIDVRGLVAVEAAEAA